MLLDAQFCKFTKSQYIVSLHWVNFMEYNLYFNKAIFKKEQPGMHKHELESQGWI